MKKRFANAKCLLLLLLILSLLPLLCGCAAQSEQTTLYVKKIELDKDEIGFRLYVTVLSEDAFTGSKGASDKSDTADESDKSDESEKSDTSDTSADGASTEKNAAGLASSGRDTAESDPTTLVYGGKTPRDAFDAFGKRRCAACVFLCLRRLFCRTSRTRHTCAERLFCGGVRCALHGVLRGHPCALFGVACLF